jgi:hypothetical protein
MPDENMTNLSIGVDENDPFDLASELADLLALCPPSVPEDEPGLTNKAGKSIAEISFATDKNIDQNKPQPIHDNSVKWAHYRHPLRWHVAIVNKSSGKHDIYHGRTHDLSLHVASVLIERNILFTSEIVILLSVPPTHLGQKKTIIEIECSARYTLLDSVHNQFRLEMKFIHFKGDGKAILSDILSKRHVPIGKPKSYYS